MGALKDMYLNECVPALKEEFGYKNAMQIPQIKKIGACDFIRNLNH